MRVLVFPEAACYRAAYFHARPPMFARNVMLDQGDVVLYVEYGPHWWPITWKWRPIIHRNLSDEIRLRVMWLCFTVHFKREEK